MQAVVVPRDHFSVVTYAHPVRPCGEAGLQSRGRLRIRRFGVGAVAHLDQPREIVAGRKAGIHPSFAAGWRVGVRLILLFQLHTPCLQVLQNRLLLGQVRLMFRDDLLTRGQLLGQPG